MMTPTDIEILQTALIQLFWIAIACGMLFGIVIHDSAFSFFHFLYCACRRYVIKRRLMANSALVSKIDSEDLYYWPDGGMCFRYEYEDFGFARSDDFEIVAYGTARWRKLLEHES